MATACQLSLNEHIDLFTGEPVKKPEFTGLFSEANKKAAAPLVICPLCGSPVRESDKGFFATAAIADLRFGTIASFGRQRKNR